MNTAVYSDQDYIEGIKNSDNRVCREIYRLIRPKVIKLLLKHGAQESEAEDAFSNSMVALFAKAQKGTLLLKESTKFETFLSAVCLRQLSNLRKKNSRVNPVTNETLAVLKDDAHMEDDLLDASRFRLFVECMKRLDQKCQEVLHAFLVERRSMKEIAVQLSSTEGFAKKKKWSCRNKLVKLIQAHSDYQSLKFAL